MFQNKLYILTLSDRYYTDFKVTISFHVLAHTYKLKTTNLNVDIEDDHTYHITEISYTFANEFDQLDGHYYYYFLFEITSFDF